MTVTERVAAPRKGTPLRPGLVLAGLLLVAANLRAAITSVGPVLDELRHDLGLTSLTASALISLPLIAFAVVSPVAPVVARRLGIERTLGAGLVGLAAGLVVRSLPGAAPLWLGTALVGVAVAVLNVVLPALVKRDFPGRIGPVTGAYSSVQASFAAIAAGLAVPAAGWTSTGWRLPLGMWAGLAVVALAVLTPQLGRRVNGSPDGPAPLPGQATAPGHEGARGAGETGRRAGVRGAASPWRTALGWQITAFMALQSTGYYILITWLPSIESSSGVPATAAGVHQLLLNAFGIAGSVACSALIPRLRDQRLLGMVGPVLYAVSALGILLAPHWGAVWASVAGVAGGSNIVLALSFFGLRTSNHHQAAALSGMAQCVGYLVAAAGPPAVGALHDATGSWTPALLAMIGVDAVLVVFGYLAGRDRVIA